MKKINWRRKILVSVLFLTSFSSLIYELVWSRELSHVFGTSMLAISTVLTIFMAGLAFGSLFGGKFIDRSKNKYTFISCLEIGIGVSCLATLFLFKIIKFPYLIIYEIFGNNNLLFNIIQFLLCALVLIIPTFLIGIIFPAIVKLYHQEYQHKGKSVGISYFADTFGGALGIAFSGFFLIALIGLWKVSVIASFVNLFLGIFLLIYSREFATKPQKAEKLKQTKEKSETKNYSENKLILFLFFFSGFAALVFEVIWTRYISLIYGSSIYSFTIVLISVLLGFALGSLLISRFLNKFRDKFVLFSLIELFIGLTALLSTLLFPYLEKWFLQLFYNINSYFLFIFLLSLTCFFILLIPAALMGMTLPVLGSIYLSDLKIGTSIGKLFSFNSFGAIFGSLLAGFFIIPHFGLVQSSIFAALVYIIIAILFVYYFISEKKTFVISFYLVFTFFSFLLFFSKSQGDYTFQGVYYHGTRYKDESVYFKNKERYETLFLKNSIYGQVSVVKDKLTGGVLLKNNGKTDASTSTGDVSNQLLSAHLPLMLHNNPKNILNIGIGGGFTLAAIEKYDIDFVDAVEIDPTVIEVDKTILSKYNENSLNNKKADIILADGRNYLFTTKKKYDVIISEPPNIWVSGVSNLFTKEFYEIAKSHLKEGGMLSQWFPQYEMSEKDYKVALNTLVSVFPYIYEFKGGAVEGGDTIIIASENPIDVLNSIHKERFESDPIKEDFRKITKDNLSLEEIFRNQYLRGNDELIKFISDVQIINSDDLPFLEFSTLRNKYNKFRSR